MAVWVWFMEVYMSSIEVVVVSANLCVFYESMWSVEVCMGSMKVCVICVIVWSMDYMFIL